MRHEVRLCGPAFELRPAEINDAGFILDLRRDADLAKYLHPIGPSLKDQEAWLEDYFTRPGDLYFVVVRRSTGRREGTIGIYNIEALTRTAEWGRWIVRRDSMAAVESAWLIYRAAFDVLGFDSVYCRTVAANGRVVSFHTSCGLLTRRYVAGVQLGERSVDMLEQYMTRVDWQLNEGRLAERAAAVARMLER